MDGKLYCTCSVKNSSRLGNTSIVFMCAQNDPSPSRTPEQNKGTGRVTYTKKFNRIAHPSESL